VATVEEMVQVQEEVEVMVKKCQQLDLVAKNMFGSIIIALASHHFSVLG
jgi:hypothetical protein